MEGRTQSRSTGLFLALCAAMLVLAIVTQQSWATGARGAAKAALAPLEQGMMLAATGFDHATAALGDISTLKSENQRLQSENQALRRQVAELSAAGLDNKALRQALDFQRSSGHQMVAAQVIGRGPDGFSRTLEIDRGGADGLRVGMIVASGAGLVGRVTEIGPHVAIVQTLADPQSRVNVFLSKSGLQGTVVGGTDSLQVQIQHRLGVSAANGEWAITSGVGGGYPRGLVVGEVASVTHRDSSTTDQALVAWSNDPGSISLVLVITDFAPA
ncbi:MAG TPA: rod shape-determining protein MreC [Candidatus Dormibacteraeota bacterium]|nr:rod shape-determining protein MreC [Candidatus Dormibacteraeota bacterium]